MKRVLLVFSILIISMGIFSQDYYWYKNQKVYLQQGDERYVLINPDIKSGIDASDYIRLGVTADSSLMWGIQSSSTPITSNVIYESPSFFISRDSSNIYVTERFYVKLKQPEDYELLEHYAQEHNVKIIQESVLPQWYIMSCTSHCKGNAMAMANTFYESSLFEAAEPEFMNGLKHTCANDTYFSQQWNLKNTGQINSSYPMIDINFCSAHNITSGNSSVLIALIDDGVDSTHVDIHQPILRYDIPTMSNKNNLYGYNGTAASGIISAYTNNTTGIAGIAAGCSTMSISLPGSYPINVNHYVNAIICAVNNGAAIINNPWCSDTYSSYIDNAIQYALVNGRNGLGCVVVFGSGNSNGPIMYPAETFDDIIVVGAVAPCGERKSQVSCDGITTWGSCYGYELDVVAPGVFIYSTDIMGQEGASYPNISNYISNFNGTSASCAQVSAIAGLILSINPNLTQKEVGDIIASTAQKIGDYNYSTMASNGSWNYEVGYGMVDAYAAVVKAQLSTIYVEGSTYLCDSSYYYVRNLPTGATVEWDFTPPSSNILYSIIGDEDKDSVLIGLMTPIGPIFPPILKGDSSNRDITYRDPIPPYATLTATVTKDNVSYTIEKKIYPNSMGVPHVTGTDTSFIWLRYTERTFSVTNCEEVPDNQLVWKIELIEPTFFNVWPTITRGRTMTFRPITVGRYRITTTNEAVQCGVNSYTKDYSVVRTLPAKGKSQNIPESLPQTSLKNELSSPHKILRDGHIYILHNGKMYDTHGVLIQ